MPEQPLGNRSWISLRLTCSKPVVDGQHAQRCCIIRFMVRPCFLVIDREFPGSISTRKLVIETAKFNVITAYSADEGIQMLKLFPAVSGVVIDDGIEGIQTEGLVVQMKTLNPALPVVVIAAPDAPICKGADHQVQSFEPAKLLETLKSIVPSAAQAIEKQNEKLSHERLS